MSLILDAGNTSLDDEIDHEWMRMFWDAGSQARTCSS
ncbi:hypothetical protein J2X66_005878 [Pseudomonas sp. 3296]|nr:hypothetical protein [Pseudomonas sp. 3296]